ncbi:MAG: hypothetical protein PHV60_02560 [bacterium]|nr:hypothetical protein [bacterium]
MKHRKAALLALFIGWVTSLALLSGCNKKTGSVTSNESSTQAELENIINQNPDIFTTDQEESEEATAYTEQTSASGNYYISGYYVGASSATLPQGWFRKKKGSPHRNITIEQVGNFATATISTNWTGSLYVDRTNDGKRNPGSKPISDRGVKKAYFENIYGVWTLKKVSCVDHTLADPAKQTVDIEKVEARASGQTYTITDPENLMDLSTGLPTFAPGTQVTVVATVNNTLTNWSPPMFVYLHHGMRWARHRQLMFDDGTNGDEVANDNKYTGVYTVGSGDQTYRSAVIDVLDSGCLQNETNDDYNSTAWRIPYKVQ